VLSQMASDSEGLRHIQVSGSFVDDESQMASDSEGLRPRKLKNSKISKKCRKWLPIRKGYDSRSWCRCRYGCGWCRKWLPIRKGYDFQEFLGRRKISILSQMASDSEGLRQ